MNLATIRFELRNVASDSYPPMRFTRLIGPFGSIGSIGPTVCIVGSILLLLPCRSLDAQRDPRAGASALAIEAVGGVAGSLAGVGAGLLITRAVNECESEDLVCDLRRVTTTAVASVIGAAAGTYVAGRAADTDPSLLGGILGALAGTAAGVGVVHLLTEETNVARNNATLVIAYSVTQGIVAAVGSRVVASFRQ